MPLLANMQSPRTSRHDGHCVADTKLIMTAPAEDYKGLLSCVLGHGPRLNLWHRRIHGIQARAQYFRYLQVVCLLTPIVLDPGTGCGVVLTEAIRHLHVEQCCPMDRTHRTTTGACAARGHRHPGPGHWQRSPPCGACAARVSAPDRLRLQRGFRPPRGRSAGQARTQGICEARGEQYNMRALSAMYAAGSIVACGCK